MNYRQFLLGDVADVAALYMASFNAPPWNEHWTLETASQRLRQMLQRPSAYGLLAYEEQGLCGMILGDAEPFYNGMQFQIREFCVDNSRRGQGLGTKIYQELERQLQQRGVGEIILYTLRHPAAEGFYTKMGLQTNEAMVFMQKKLS